jgi:hypothetical protein
MVLIEFNSIDYVEAVRKQCGDVVKRFINRRYHHPSQYSQEAAEIMIPLYNWQITTWEAYPRVDVLVKFGRKLLNLEVKYISNPIEQKSNLLKMIRKTQNQIEKKRLNGLILISAVQKYMLDAKGFKTNIENCLISIFMSDDQLEKASAEKLGEEIISSFTELLEDDEEFVSHLSAQIALTDEKHDEFVLAQERFNEDQKKFNEDQKKFNEDQKKFNEDQKQFNEKLEGYMEDTASKIDRIMKYLEKNE